MKYEVYGSGRISIEPPAANGTIASIHLSPPGGRLSFPPARHLVDMTPAQYAAACRCFQSEQDVRTLLGDSFPASFKAGDEIRLSVVDPDGNYVLRHIPLVLSWGKP